MTMNRQYCIVKFPKANRRKSIQHLDAELARHIKLFWACAAKKLHRLLRCNLCPAIKRNKGFPLHHLTRNWGSNECYS